MTILRLKKQVLLYLLWKASETRTCLPVPKILNITFSLQKHIFAFYFDIYLLTHVQKTYVIA